ncbi:MAG: MerR family transcriptional regulator [Bryobacteraceae bacterium]
MSGSDEPRLPDIPNKLYFRIGEASSLLGLEPYVLRYWETEFPSLAPKKSGTGQRLYRRKDIDLLFRIKHLLYEKRYTIEGAKHELQSSSTVRQDPSSCLKEIRAELSRILELIN